MYLGRLGSVPWEAWKCTLTGLEVYLWRLGSVPWRLGSVPWQAWKCTFGGLEMYLGMHSGRLGSVPCEACSNPRKQGLGFRK